MRVRQHAKHNMTGKFYICSLVNDVISNSPMQQLLVDEENKSCPSLLYFLNTNGFSVQETWHKWNCGLHVPRGHTPMKSIFSTWRMDDTFNFLKDDKNGLMLQYLQ